MVKVKEDLTGRRFGRLVIIKQAEDYISPNGSILVAFQIKMTPLKLD